MALIVETGEGLANADSLVTLAEARAFAESRGLSLASVDATLEAQIRLAHDYLLANEFRLAGCRRTEGQALSYPRYNYALYGYAVASGTIPQGIKNVITQLVIEGSEIELLPSTDGKVVVQETVGPISTTYAQSGVSGGHPTFPRVEALLAPFLSGGDTSGALTGVRV